MRADEFGAENNFDGQLNQVIRVYHAEDLSHLKSMALGDGLPMTAEWIVSHITAAENGQA